jgi:hypothetical protein
MPQRAARLAAITVQLVSLPFCGKIALCRTGFLPAKKKWVRSPATPNSPGHFIWGSVRETSIRGSEIAHFCLNR